MTEIRDSGEGKQNGGEKELKRKEREKEQTPNSLEMAHEHHASK